MDLEEGRGGGGLRFGEDLNPLTVESPKRERKVRGIQINSLIFNFKK